MSREIDRKFDMAMGQCIVTIEDDNGVKSVHTINLLDHEDNPIDVEETVHGILVDAAARAQLRRQVAEKHGWKPSNESN